MFLPAASLNSTLGAAPSSEVSQDRGQSALHVALRVVVVNFLVHRVKELVALPPVVAIIGVRGDVVADLLADGDRRLRASKKLDSKSGEHELMI